MKDKTKADARFEKYSGKKMYEVRHHENGALKVLAPDENCAIVAAAGFWGCRWQDYSFYPYCEVTRI